MAHVYTGLFSYQKKECLQNPHSIDEAKIMDQMKKGKEENIQKELNE